RAGGVGGDDPVRESQFVQQAPYVSAARRVALGAGVDDDPAEVRTADGTAERGTRFQDRHPHADLGALAGRDQAGYAAADCDDVPRRRASGEVLGLLLGCGHTADPSCTCSVRSTECASSTMRVSWSGSVSGGTPCPRLRMWARAN